MSNEYEVRLVGEKSTVEVTADTFSVTAQGNFVFTLGDALVALFTPNSVASIILIAGDTPEEQEVEGAEGATDADAGEGQATA